MAKLNEALKAELVFNNRETVDPDFHEHRQIVISTEYKGIYRQYSFHVGHDAHKPEDLPMLEEEAKNILTMAIQKELSKNNTL